MIRKQHRRLYGKGYGSLRTDQCRRTGKNVLILLGFNRIQCYVELSNRKEDDLSIVHVFIGQDSFYAKVRKELYGPTDLFGMN